MSHAIRNIVVATCTTIAAAGATAQGTTPVEVRLATAAPQKSVWGMQIERGATAAQAAGAVRINPYFGGQLGGELEIVQQVVRGRLDAGAVSGGMAATVVPEAQLLGLPMYFASQAEHDCALDRHLAEPLAERFAAKGLQLVAFGEGGTVGYAGRKPYAVPADFAGAKAASFGSRISVLAQQALGAYPVAISTAEIGSGLATGLVDYALLYPVFYVAAGLNRHAPVFTRNDSIFGPTMVVYNKAFWDRLTPEQRAAIEHGHRHVPMGQIRREVRDVEAAMLAAHAQAGGRVVTPTAEQRQEMRQRYEPVWAQAVRDFGPEGASFFARMEAARKACAGAN